MIVFIKEDYIRLPNNHSRILSIISRKSYTTIRVFIKIKYKKRTPKSFLRYIINNITKFEWTSYNNGTETESNLEKHYTSLGYKKVVI